VQRGLEIGDAGLDRVVAGIMNRSDADRRQGPRPRGNPGLRVTIRRGEPATVVTIAKARQYDVTGLERLASISYKLGPPGSSAPRRFHEYLHHEP
jgi:hypothetical protein